MEKMTHKKIVLDILESTLDGYIKDDIASLRNISIVKSGACSTPLALSIFSAMDLFGYLTDKTVHEGNSYEAIASYLNNYMMLVNDEYNSICDLLLIIYRDGILQRYLPKANFAITRRSSTASVLIDEDSFLVLNAEKLADDFLLSSYRMTEEFGTLVDGDERVLLFCERWAIDEKYYRHIGKAACTTNNSLLSRSIVDVTPIIKKSEDKSSGN